jgi:hypothetical protein
VLRVGSFCALLEGKNLVKYTFEKIFLGGKDLFEGVHTFCRKMPFYENSCVGKCSCCR